MSREYRKWVDEYQHQAWTLARYILKDPAEAQDATQEAFVKLWNNRNAIDRDRVKPWLMRVTRNHCLDRLRRRRPEQEFVDDVRKLVHAEQADNNRQDQDCWRSVVSGVEHEVSFIGRAGYLYTVSLIQNPTT